MDNYFIIEEPCLDYFTEKVSQTLEYCLFGNIGAQLAASFCSSLPSSQSSLSNRKAFVVPALIKSSTSFLVTLPFSRAY